MSKVLMAVLSLMFAMAVADRGDKYKGVKDINPIMRYWAQSRLRRKLPLLDAMAAKNQKDDSLKYRNCYFSPVQCQLPVTLDKDPLVSALNMESQDRFRRWRNKK